MHLDNMGPYHLQSTQHRQSRLLLQDKRGTFKSRSLLFLLEMHSSCSHGEDNGSPWVLCANTESQKDVLLKSEDITGFNPEIPEHRGSQHRSWIPVRLSSVLKPIVTWGLSEQ